MLLTAQLGEVQMDWPAEADLIISALEAGSAIEDDRRRAARASYRAVTLLRLFSDDPEAQPWILYTRDGDARGMGFITRHRLPLGYGGIIELPNSAGEMFRAHCTLLRCRQATPGWYEGALYFNRPQNLFV